MNKYLVILGIVLITSCTTKTEKPGELALAINHTDAINAENNPLLYSVFNKPDIEKDLYAVKFSAYSHGNALHDLTIDMRLKNDGHFVSPNATRDFKGKFTMIIDKNSDFNLVGNLIESPRSVEEIDLHPFVNGPVNWVRKNTTYTQQIRLNSSDDFEVIGFIQFTIEPACTLEKVPFIIKQVNGVLQFEFFEC
ncbi:hypothetical protein [Hanstruepera marina]|uniref:hypothetical protein n=1 Tax=Hanstruepera marina TaxID=2873265 RepID=UPI001CA76321|nr:hypothetical protein [Hanstruepera marina]